MTPKIRTFRKVLIISALAVSWPLGWWIQETYLSAPLIVGGSVCETAVVSGKEMLGCYGYPPSGIILVVFVLLLAAELISHSVGQLAAVVR